MSSCMWIDWNIVADRRTQRRAVTMPKVGSGSQRGVAMTETVESLAELYETDETAWREAMAKVIAAGRYAELDYVHLQDYLTDTVNRDRRELRSRLRFYLAHLLKWIYHPETRTGAWAASILRVQCDL